MLLKSFLQGARKEMRPCRSPFLLCFQGFFLPAITGSSPINPRSINRNAEVRLRRLNENTKFLISHNCCSLCQTAGRVRSTQKETRRLPGGLLIQHGAA